MATLTFRSFSGKRWNTSRWQPEIYLADERAHAFAIPEVDGSLVVGEIGARTGAALHARFPVPSFGEVTLPTGILPPADRPYVLPVELATERSGESIRHWRAGKPLLSGPQWRCSRR